MKNHLGSYECKLCLTLHNNEVRPRPAPPHPTCAAVDLLSPSVPVAPLPQMCIWERGDTLGRSTSGSGS